MIERPRCDHEPGVLGGFFMAAKAGIVDCVLELPAHADGLSLSIRDAGGVTAVPSRGQDAKATTIGMLLE